MKSLKNTDFLNGKSDSGAALALVLLMVIFLSLWLSSVFLVSASSKKAIDTNIAQAQLKDTNIDAALQQALAVINGQSVGSSAPGYNGSCASTSINYTAPDGTVIQVQCNQAADSGIAGPIASFVLTGTNSTCGSSCVTGVDGGLNIVSSTTANQCQAISKFKFTGGIFNSSGSFQNVNACTTQVDAAAGQNTPVITAPASALSGFPSSNGPVQQYTNGPTQEVQPARYVPGTTSNATNPDVNPAGTNPPAGSSSNVVFDYLRNESQKLDKDGDKTDSKNLALISYASSKADTWDSRATGACSVNTYSDGYIHISPSSTKSGFGRITGSMLQRLNELSNCSSPATIIFEPGTYRFVADKTSTNKANYEWFIQNGTKVIGGVPVKTSGVITDCDTNQVGVQLQFQDTFLTFGKSKVWLCDDVTGTTEAAHQHPVISAPRNGDGAEFSWSANGRKNSNGDDAFLSIMDYKTQTSGHEHEYNYLSSSEKNYQDHEGSDHNGKFETWKSSEQSTWAAKLGKTVAQLTSDDKVRGEARRGIRDDLNKSDHYYSVSSCQVCVTIHGSILAPAGWANTWENSLVKWVVDLGMNFRALTVHIDNESSNNSRAIPGRYAGDRLVQLRFLAKQKGSNAFKPIGMETVQIADYQGRHPGSGYKVIARQLNTNTNG